MFMAAVFYSLVNFLMTVCQIKILFDRIQREKVLQVGIYTLGMGKAKAKVYPLRTRSN